MADPKRSPVKKQMSKTSLEQSLSMISAPKQAPITIYPGPHKELATLSKADLEIAQRLENLKQTPEKVPSEDEMAARLAQLKGLPQNSTRMSAAAAAYSRPETRTRVEQSKDLLTQVMEEVYLDSKVPDPCVEIEGRLAKLKGVDSPAKSTKVSHAPVSFAWPHEEDIGEDVSNMNLDEVELLMKRAEKEASSEASKAIAGLHSDPDISQAIALATKKKEEKKKGKKDSSEGGSNKLGLEKISGSDEDSDSQGPGKIDAAQEQKEIQRIIDMYVKQNSERKKKKKKKLREAAAAKLDDDSDLELSDDSLLTSESTSEDEKYSDLSD
ncbi:uncharacterized protein LOC143038866 [Oratosquilla oratoria]|uniref:uncharacterized protein LOC143038866 n=1 Tax=Oratosquilla oratoria TaxID=337810 RepID=UPI003F761268